MDKDKTYIIGSIGRGAFAQAIQAGQTQSTSRLRERLTHVSGAYFHKVLNTWVVVESVWQHGVRLLTLYDFYQENHRKVIHVWEYPEARLNPIQLNKHIGKSYAFLDVGLVVARRRFFPYDDNNNQDKLFCSELLANCDNGFISSAMNYSPSRIVPDDYQDYFKLAGIPPVSLQDCLFSSTARQ
jgi:hypothetical protein